MPALHYLLRRWQPVHVVFDSATLAALRLPIAFPLLPLAIMLLGDVYWTGSGSGPDVPFLRRKATFLRGSFALFVVVAALCWGNVIRVELNYHRGAVKSVEGTVRAYRVSGAGKSVSFEISGVQFHVSCCPIAPVYSGTPSGSLSGELLSDGMSVRVTYLDTGEIVRIEAANP